MASGEGGRCRARELGIVVGPGVPGPYNAITDVPGVTVGHTTLRRPPAVHSGVTAIVPSGIGPSPGRTPLPAGLFAGNGYGKLVGATQLVELGQLESPVVLTSTLSAFRAADAVVSWMLELPECDGVTSFNPVVGECNDGRLSDIRGRPVREEHVLAAIRGAAGGPVPEGCVGAGTGTCALGYKAGIGTSSRRPVTSGAAVTVGVLTQANFGGTLRVGGVPVVPEASGTEASETSEAAEPSGESEAGSCMIVVATDAPLDARQLGRLARRAVFALARVGASYGNGSGDYALAFSTRGTGGTRGTPAPFADDALDPLFGAVLDAVEESVLNALSAATTTTGPHGHTTPAIPLDLLRRHVGEGVLRSPSHQD